MYADETSVTCSAEDNDEVCNDLRMRLTILLNGYGRISLVLTLIKQNTWPLVTKDKKPNPWSIRGKYKWRTNQTGQKS